MTPTCVLLLPTQFHQFSLVGQGLTAVTEVLYENPELPAVGYNRVVALPAVDVGDTIPVIEWEITILCCSLFLMSIFGMFLVHSLQTPFLLWL